MSRQVKIKVQNVGQAFGCMAIVRDAKSRTRLAETDVFPYGMYTNAYQAAIGLAADKGWTVVG